MLNIVPVNNGIATVQVSQSDILTSQLPWDDNYLYTGPYAGGVRGGSVEPPFSEATPTF